MAFDDYNLNTAISTAVADSFNETTTNTLGVEVGVADSFNETTTLENVGNTDVDLTDSFHEDSHNTDVDIDDSGNTDSYNDTIDASDRSVNDDSINAGVRSYNTGFGDLSFGGAAAAAGAAGGGGDLTVTNHNTVVDQSVNGNVAAFGPVHQVSANESVVASGPDSIAAGDDVSVDTYVDQGTYISAEGDVLIDGSTKTVEVDINSGNTNNFSYSETDSSIDVDIDDSWNTATWNTEVTDSFNDESLVFNDTDVEVDVNAIVGSYGAGIADGVDVDL